MLNIVHSFMARHLTTFMSAPALTASAATLKAPMALYHPAGVPVARITPAPERRYTENILACRRRRARRRMNRH